MADRLQERDNADPGAKLKNRQQHERDMERQPGDHDRRVPGEAPQQIGSRPQDGCRDQDPDRDRRQTHQPLDHGQRHVVHRLGSDTSGRRFSSLSVVAAAPKTMTVKITARRSPCAAAAIGFCGTIATIVWTNVGTTLTVGD